MSHTGAQFGQIAQFLLRQVDLPEQGIGENLVQLGEKPVLVGGGEIAVTGRWLRSIRLT